MTYETLNNAAAKLAVKCQEAGLDYISEQIYEVLPVHTEDGLLRFILRMGVVARLFSIRPPTEVIAKQLIPVMTSLKVEMESYARMLAPS